MTNVVQGLVVRLLGSSLVLIGLGFTPSAHGQSCSSFRTCQEAIDSLRSGNTRIDGDSDGIPCESLCRGYAGGSRPGRPAPIPDRRARPVPAAATEGPARLVSVGDGDTIRVMANNGQKVTIRLACIDAPERAQGASGAQATAYLKQLMAQGALVIRPQTADRYGRTVAEVMAGGRNVNLQMVAAGQAYAYRQYLSGCDKAAYLAAERQAEQKRLGVWRGGSTQQRPWEFRQKR